MISSGVRFPKIGFAPDGGVTTLHSVQPRGVMSSLFRHLPLCLCVLVLTLGGATGMTGATGLEEAIVTEGQPLTLAAEVGGGEGPFTYQWFKDGAPMAGATGPQYRVVAAAGSDAGLYAVVVANGAGSAASPPVLVKVSSAQPGRLANVSIIAPVSETVVMGFTLGDGAAARSRLLARAAGPALTQFGVSGALTDPVLELSGPGGVLAANDNWGGGEVLTMTAASVGAFPFWAESRDAALVADLPAGAYTARVMDAAGRPGTTAVELYEVRGAGALPAARLVKLFARAVTGSGSSPFTLGFTIEGHEPIRLLVRGLGPALTGLGGPTPLADPRLHLFRGAVLVASNEDWGDTQAAEIAAAAAAGGAFALPGGSRDAALLVTLDPGAYTVHLANRQALTGLALIELYVVP